MTQTGEGIEPHCTEKFRHTSTLDDMSKADGSGKLQVVC